MINQTSKVFCSFFFAGSHTCYRWVGTDRNDQSSWATSKSHGRIR